MSPLINSILTHSAFPQSADMLIIVSHIRRNVQLAKIDIFLSTPAETAISAAQSCYQLSIMAYRIGRGFHLYRTALPPVNPQIMDIDCAGFTGYGPHELLTAEIIGECIHCGYTGINLGLSSKPTQPIVNFCLYLSKACQGHGITLYLPESFSSVCQDAMIIIPGQNIRGTYSQYLGSMCSRYGAQRLALELERIYMDFSLPSRSGVGSVLSERRFQEIYTGSSFYSDALLANYTSYISGGNAHIVLWNDGKSLSQKLSQAVSAGIGHAFLYYPHVSDILSEIRF